MLALLATLALSGCARTYFAGINAGSHEPPPAQAELFDARNGLRLDVYRPDANAAPRAAIVFFYGGRWRNGQRDWYRFVGDALSQRGFVVVVPDYRRYPSVEFPEFAYDAASAIAWTLRNARALGVDPSRVYAAGHSAGAHLAALVATDPRYLARHGLRPRALAGVIGIAGAYDFLPLGRPDLQQVFASPEQQHDSQPIHFVDGDEPPFLLLHGRRDRATYASNSTSLAKRLRRAGVPVTLRLYDAGHVRILTALRFSKLAPTLADIERFVADAPPVQPDRRHAGH